MLGPVGLVDQFRQHESQLPADWEDVRVALDVSDQAQVNRAAALLAPLGAGRSGTQLQVTVTRAGGDAERFRRLLGKLDRERIGGLLELVTFSSGVPQAGEVSAAWPGLEDTWLAAVAALPDDWSDLYAEVELASSDLLPRAALLLAPLNPSRLDRGLALKFRVARSFGYGASAEMARRCLERLDDEGIKARLSINWAFSDTKAVATQGPVVYGERGPV